MHKTNKYKLKDIEIIRSNLKIAPFFCEIKKKHKINKKLRKNLKKT